MYGFRRSKARGAVRGCGIGQSGLLLRTGVLRLNLSVDVRTISVMLRTFETTDCTDWIIDGLVGYQSVNHQTIPAY